MIPELLDYTIFIEHFIFISCLHCNLLIRGGEMKYIFFINRKLYLLKSVTSHMLNLSIYIYNVTSLTELGGNN